jgi:hypothetical protein
VRLNDAQRSIGLLLGSEAATLSAWLKAHPGGETSLVESEQTCVRV